MKRLVISSLLVLVGATVPVVLAAAPAHAYEVHVSITGAGQVTETTPADLLGSGCTTSASNPTGGVGVDCYPGTVDGPYDWAWTVRYLATPKPGYRFVHWKSDGSPNPVICDGANGSSTYTGTACQFATYNNLQIRAVFEDVTAPSMSSLSGPNGAVSGATTFTFAATADPTLSHFECRVANVHDWTSCTSGRFENPSTSGDYTFEVRAVDTSGNRSPISEWDWTVDKIAPETSLTAGPSAPVASTTASFEFTSNEPGTFTCSLDGAPYATCGSPKNYSSLAQGQHTFHVRATDAAGNTDASPVVRTWTVDTVAPDTVLTATPPVASGSSSAVFEFDTSGGEPATFRCVIDGGPLQACTSPLTVPSLADGSHTVTVRASDTLGNTDATPASHTWTVDTADPGTTLTTKPPALTRSATAAFAYTSDEAGGGFECTLDGDTTPCTTSYVVADGRHTFTVAARDAAGNLDETPATHTWTVDTVRPRVRGWAPRGTAVPPRANVVVVFSEAMREATVEAARRGRPTTFVLRLGRAVVPATVTYRRSGGRFEAVLNPTRNLLAGRAYGATVTGSARDLAGHQLLARTWTFRVRR